MAYETKDNVAMAHDYVISRLAVGPFNSRTSTEFVAVVTCVTSEELDDLTWGFTRNLVPEDVPIHFVELADNGLELGPQIDSAVEFIDKHISSGNVLIHCAAGMSRSVSVCIAYLVSHGMDVLDAIALVKDKRRCAAPNPAFINTIKAHYGTDHDQ